MTTTNVLEAMKQPLTRVTFPVKMRNKVQELAVWKHTTVAHFMRQAVQEKIDVVDRQKKRQEARHRKDGEQGQGQLL
jgi:hypothetical protein